MTLTMPGVTALSVANHSIVSRVAWREPYMMKSLIAVIIGGSVGCAIRWLLSVRLNALWSRPCRLETADHYRPVR